MTVDELRALYTEGVRIVRAERRMRAYVFRENPPMLEAKLREIDRLLDKPRPMGPRKPIRKPKPSSPSCWMYRANMSNIA
jgi:hypothetical protein